MSDAGFGAALFHSTLANALAELMDDTEARRKLGEAAEQGLGVVIGDAQQLIGQLLVRQQLADDALLPGHQLGYVDAHALDRDAHQLGALAHRADTGLVEGDRRRMPDVLDRAVDGEHRWHALVTGVGKSAVSNHVRRGRELGLDWDPDQFGV